ncbi:MAG: DUF3575 domain-containing protein [Bacteroidaceae bacterium]|nr:DUF3575 domain-containing protein [Bacteroidaceae bacterium]
MLRYRQLAIIFLFSCVLHKANAQILETHAQVETLSLAERISVKTNAVDWLLQNPNVAFEFDVRKENWNRWAAVLYLKGHLAPKNTYTPGFVFNNSQVRVEARNYWRTRKLDGRYIMPHDNWLDKLFSFRRMHPKHPLTVYYRGLYASYDNFSFLLGNNKGVQGTAISGGVTYGIIRPLTVFKGGSSVDLEFGISAGAAYVKYDKYRHDRESNCYPITAKGKKGIYPVVNDLRVGLVYRFGNFPMTKKYRFRYDVDMQYRDRMDSLMLNRDNRDAEKLRIDTLTHQAEEMFWDEYKRLTDEKRLKRYREKAERTGQDVDSLTNKMNAQHEKYSSNALREKGDKKARKAQKIRERQRRKELMRSKLIKEIMEEGA